MLHCWPRVPIDFPDCTFDAVEYGIQIAKVYERD